MGESCNKPQINTCSQQVFYKGQWMAMVINSKTWNTFKVMLQEKGIIDKK